MRFYRILFVLEFAVNIELGLKLDFMDCID